MEVSLVELLRAGGCLQLPNIHRMLQQQAMRCHESEVQANACKVKVGPTSMPSCYLPRLSKR